MAPTSLLPAYLVQRYHGWKATTFAENEAWLRRLAVEGQRPRAMVISCCDSRVHATAIFGAEQGEFFLHRNIANLVPAFADDGGVHGTSAAIEYAVTALKVSHLIVLGHSQCGGVKGCHDMCAGHAPQLEEKTSFVGRWMDGLRPGYEKVKDIQDDAERVSRLEREGVLVSLDNLMTFPFVASAVAEGTLSLHGLWTNIETGQLEQFDPAAGDFVTV